MDQLQENIYNLILNNIILNHTDNAPSDTILRKVPITFIIATTDTIDIEKLLNDANAVFEELSISLYSYDTLIVDNFDFYNLESSEEGVSFRNAYYDFRSLNVYFVNSFGTNEGFAPHFGKSQNYGFGNWVTLSTLYGLPEDNNSFTFIHELGHHFGLKHTHNGTDNNVDCVIEGDNVELVNGEECDIRGDKLCDTPADPNLSPERLVNAEDCSFNNSKCSNENGVFCECADANGDSYKPDTGNYMSYTREICGDHFTAMQKSIIDLTYDDIELLKYTDCNGMFMGNNWSCAGCMESTACNYDANASIDNFTCEFPTGAYDYEHIIDDGNCALVIETVESNNKYTISTHPNPFNPTISISFTIPKFSFTSIKTYDISGKHLKTLINSKLNSGSYIVDWNASSYPSGVYIIRMDSNNFIQTNKVMFVK